MSPFPGKAKWRASLHQSDDKGDFFLGMCVNYEAEHTKTKHTMDVEQKDNMAKRFFYVFAVTYWTKKTKMDKNMKILRLDRERPLFPAK